MLPDHTYVREPLPEHSGDGYLWSFNILLRSVISRKHFSLLISQLQIGADTVMEELPVLMIKRDQCGDRRTGGAGNREAMVAVFKVNNGVNRGISLR